MRFVFAAMGVFFTLQPLPGFAQAWNIDARTVGLAGIGGDQNVFTSAVSQAQGDRSIVIPLGLVQTLRNLDTFKPKSTGFDPVRAIETANNPLHFQFGSTKTGPAAAFVHGIRNATFSRDLNDYRGFVPESFTVDGLI